MPSGEICSLTERLFFVFGDAILNQNPAAQSVNVRAHATNHKPTVEQFKRHITDDVLPPLLNKLSVEPK